MKTIPGKTLQTTEWTTNSWEFWCLCKRFTNFYIKWIQIYYRRIIFKYRNRINTFQWQICWLNSKLFLKILFFVICYLKRKWKIRYSIHFLADQKEIKNKTKFTYSLLLHISSFLWRIYCHHNEHTKSIFPSIRYQITCKIKT